MRRTHRLLKWLLLPSFSCAAWYAGSYYQGVQAECSAPLEKVELMTPTGQHQFHGTIDISLPRRQSHYEIFHENGTLAWSGTVYIKPNMDIQGRITSLTVEDIFTSISSEKPTGLTQLSEGVTYPYSFEKVDKHVAWLRLGNFFTFCKLPN